MSGYSNHTQFNADYLVGSNAARDNEYTTSASTAGPTALHYHNLQATANALAPLRGVVPTMQQTTMQQQPQPSSQPQSQLLYDISSFDPLQAQALQLTASAGLTPADILAVAAAPGIAAAPTPAENTSAATGATNNAAPTAGLTAGIPHPVTSYSQPLAPQAQTQPPTHGASTSIPTAPVSIPGGQLQPLQPVPSPATAAQHPYIFIQPQQFASTAAPTPTATPTAYPGAPATTTTNPLLVPAPATGFPAAASLSAQAQVVAAATGLGAGLGNHPLFWNPAMLQAAATAGTIPGLAAAAAATAGRPGHVLPQPAAQNPQTHVAATTNPLAPTLILPSMNAHQALPRAHSKKRPLGNGVVMNEIAPSVVSSATEANKRQRGTQSKKVNNAEEAKRAEDPVEKRRYERNLREQQRSSKISSQIKELRDVLSECNVPFKPNKYSILLKVVEYIKQLQSRAIMLDAEHQKLITTVRQTNEMIQNAANNNGMPSATGGTTDNESSDITQDAWQQGDRVNSRQKDSDLCFVKGIDYRSVFEQCPTAFGIAALDGRILECNVEFQTLLGYTVREELLKQSLFNLVHNHQDIFRAMAQMLKTAEEPTPNTNRGPNGVNENALDRFWTGPVTSKQNVKLSMNITLTSGDNGTPKFFSCALTNSIV